MNLSTMRMTIHTHSAQRDRSSNQGGLRRRHTGQHRVGPQGPPQPRIWQGTAQEADHPRGVQHDGAPVGRRDLGGAPPGFAEPGLSGSRSVSAMPSCNATRHAGTRFRSHQPPREPVRPRVGALTNLGATVAHATAGPTGGRKSRRSDHPKQQTFPSRTIQAWFRNPLPPAAGGASIRQDCQELS